MRIRLFAFNCLLIGTLLTSCSTSKEYGSKYDRYSRDRIANIDHHPTNSRNHTREYDKKTSEKDESMASQNAHSEGKKYRNKSSYHSERNNVIREAQKYKGIPYKFAGKTPESGFDCSGFVAYVFEQQNIFLNGSAENLSKLGNKKSRSQLEKGDLIFFGNGKKITHVGIVSLNDGENLAMIHASSSAGITNDNVSGNSYWAPKLLFGTDIITAHMENGIGAK